MRPLPILLTRPRADAERLAEALRAGGAGRVVLSPILRIVPAGPVPEAAALLLTSGNAVAAYVAAGGRLGLPAWTVGPRTAALAREAGLDVRGVAADAAGLAALVPKDAPPLVHLRGTETRGDLIGALRARGIAATEAIIYAQEATPLDDAARRLVAGGPVVVPLYSPRSAALVMAAFEPSARLNVYPVCLSGAVASACSMAPLAIADRPDGGAMLRAILSNLDPSAVEGRASTV